MKLTKENVDLINDGEYGRFEGICDHNPTISEIIELSKGLNINIDIDSIYICFDEFQGFYRFDGLMKKR